MEYSLLNNMTVAFANTASKSFKYTILVGAIFNVLGAKNEALIFIVLKSLSIIVHN